ncbi:MAG: endonuclease III domain-containing protein [Candidatus Micrarchaeia archaeon]
MLGLSELYSRLRENFGFLNWWPGETKEEIVVGAVLTQNTAWKNVEKAIKNLKEKNVVSIDRLAGIDLSELESLIRPAGFYRQKAKRLKGLALYIKESGGLEKFFQKDEEELRKELLSLNGIGKETADSIILYAAEKPTFVVDAYTRRIMHRIYGIDEEIEYDDLKKYFEKRLEKDLELYKDFHAQFVELGKRFCKKVPKCEGCPLIDYCQYQSKKIKSMQSK